MPKQKPSARAELLKTIEANIRYGQARLGYTRETIARALDCSKATVSTRMVHPETLTVEELWRISRLLHTTPDALFREMKFTE